MISPAGPYATIATAAAVIGTEATVDPSSWVQPTTIAGAVIVVSLFWIRRNDVDQRRERTEMRNALHRSNRLNAVLLAHLSKHQIPLPEEYAKILATDPKEES